MKTLKETIEGQLQELDREFPDIFHLPEGGMSVWLTENYTNQIKQWHTKSIHEVIDKVVEICEGKKIKSGVGSNCDDNYDKALEDLKQHLLDIKD